MVIYARTVTHTHTNTETHRNAHADTYTNRLNHRPVKHDMLFQGNPSFNRTQACRITTAMQLASHIAPSFNTTRMPNHNCNEQQGQTWSRKHCIKHDKTTGNFVPPKHRVPAVCPSHIRVARGPFVIVRHRFLGGLPFEATVLICKIR